MTGAMSCSLIFLHRSNPFPSGRETSRSTRSTCLLARRSCASFFVFAAKNVYCSSVRRYSNPMMIDSLSSISKIVSFILPFPLFFNILLIIIKETKGKVQPSIRLPAGGIFVFPQPSSRPQPFHCRITRQIHFLQTTGADHFP